MRKISMKRKSKTPNSEVPEEEKSGDEGSSTEKEAADETNGSPAKKGKKGKAKANEENGTDKKKGKKEDKEESPEEEEESEDDGEEEYEVEKVVGDKMIKGVRHYLIRWKGHSASSDTWEPATTLNCDELVQEYLDNKTTKSKKGKTATPKKKKVEKTIDDENDDEKSGDEVYEVDKILEVHFKKNGKREFLVHWKGYSASENTWEPEEHMNCHDLIERFMKKVNDAKSFETKELRVRRKPTDRYTVLMADSGRKLSKRNQNKQQVHYYDAE